MKKYIVKDGDTMWSISKKTGIRLNLLVAANPQIRDPNQLQPGSVIMIPELTKSNSSSSTTPPTAVSKAPVSKSGQSSHGTHSQGSPGSHKGKGPTDSPVPPYFGFVWPHVVKKGETWKDIADQYGISSAQLQHLNPKESPGTLDPGDIVYVPAFGFDEAGSQPGMPYTGMQPGLHHGGAPSHGHPAPSPWPYGPGPHPGHAGYPSPYAYSGAQYPGMYSPQAPGGQPELPMPPEHGIAPNSHGPHTHTPPRGEEYWWGTPDTPSYEYPYYEDDFYDPYLYRYGAGPGFGYGPEPGYRYSPGPGYGYSAGSGYDGFAADENGYVNPYEDSESFPDWGTTDFTDVEIRNYELPSKTRSDSQNQDD